MRPQANISRSKLESNTWCDVVKEARASTMTDLLHLACLCASMVHEGPALSFRRDGYDPSKPKPGMLLNRQCEKRWSAVVLHNEAFCWVSGGSSVDGISFEKKVSKEQ